MSTCYDSTTVFDMTKENALASNVIPRVKKLAAEDNKDAKSLVSEIMNGDYTDMVKVVEREFGHRLIVMQETRLD